MPASRHIGTSYPRLLALAACSLLAGCGQQGTALPTASAGTPTPPPATAGGRTGYTAFGDSITCGYVAAGATTSPPYSIGDASCHTANAYPSYMASALSLPLQNNAIPGDQACDIWPRQIAPQSVSPTSATAPLFTVLIGTNDVSVKGAGSYEADFRACSLATLTWLALPAESKTLVASAARNGWSLVGSPAFGAYAEATSPGATLAFTLTTSGGPIYLWRVASDAGSGTASLTLDGTVLGTFATAPAVPVATQNGTSDTVVAERLSGISPGTHLLVVTNLSGNQAVIGVGTPPASQTPHHPIVLVGAVPAPLQGPGDYLRAPDAAYTADSAAIAGTLLGDGLDVRFAPNALYLTGVSDEMTDLLHVSPLGATHLAEAFLAVGP